MPELEDLYEAVENKDANVALSIIREAPQLIEQKDNTGYSIIHWAVHLEHLDILTVLLSHTSDVDVRNDSGETPLHMAAKSEYPEYAKALIDAGADVNARLKISGNSTGEWTPLYFAAERFDRIPTFVKPHHEVAKMLIEAGAAVDANSAVLMGDNERLKSLIAENPNLDVVALDRHVLLENAASVKNVEGAQMLLDHGLEPDCEALATAIRVSGRSKDDDSSGLEILRMYLEAGAGEHLHDKSYANTRTNYEEAKSLKPPAGFMELIEKYNPGTS